MKYIIPILLIIGFIIIPATAGIMYKEIEINESVNRSIAKAVATHVDIQEPIPYWTHSKIDTFPNTQHMVINATIEQNSKQFVQKPTCNCDNDIEEYYNSRPWVR